MGFCGILEQEGVLNNRNTLFYHAMQPDFLERILLTTDCGTISLAFPPSIVCTDLGLKAICPSLT